MGFSTIHVLILAFFLSSCGGGIPGGETEYRYSDDTSNTMTSDIWIDVFFNEIWLHKGAGGEYLKLGSGDTLTVNLAGVPIPVTEQVVEDCGTRTGTLCIVSYKYVMQLPADTYTNYSQATISLNRASHISAPGTVIYFPPSPTFIQPTPASVFSLSGDNVNVHVYISGCTSTCFLYIAGKPTAGSTQCLNYYSRQVSNGANIFTITAGTLTLTPACSTETLIDVSITKISTLVSGVRATRRLLTPPAEIPARALRTWPE